MIRHFCADIQLGFPHRRARIARHRVLVAITDEARLMNTPARINFRKPAPFWATRREAALNWLALGLLLAAWNAADNGVAAAARKPEALRGYSPVSVRAVQRSAMGG